MLLCLLYYGGCSIRVFKSYIDIVAMGPPGALNEKKPRKNVPVTLSPTCPQPWIEIL